jgi:nitroreductase
MEPAKTDYPIHDLIARRWSPYVFAPRPVPESDVQSLLEAARWAPSSYNEQPWRFMIAARTQPEEFAKLLSCLVESNQTWAENAGFLMLGIVARAFIRNGKPNAAAEHDLGLCMGSLTFEATARGLVVHQMIGIVPQKAREVYGIPAGFDPLTAAAIGYLGDESKAPPELAQRDAARRGRRPLKETVFEGKWSQPAKIIST